MENNDNNKKKERKVIDRVKGGSSKTTRDTCSVRNMKKNEK